MDTIEGRLREFSPVQPPDRLRRCVLAGALSEWSVERARWRRTLRWATAAATLIVLGATLSEYQSSVRLAQIRWDVEDSQRKETIVAGLAQAIPENTDVALERYLASQATTPPRPRASNTNLTYGMDAT